MVQMPTPPFPLLLAEEGGEASSAGRLGTATSISFPCGLTLAATSTLSNATSISFPGGIDSLFLVCLGGLKLVGLHGVLVLRLRVHLPCILC